MSSQDAIVDSVKPKSRSTASNVVVNLFRFEGAGSLKDRLLTALIVLSCAVGITWLGLTLPYGRILGVVVASAISLLAAFEGVRLFSRDETTLAYRPVWGTLHGLAIGSPSVVGAVVGVSAVILGGFDWRMLLVSIAASAVVVTALQVYQGRCHLEEGARHAQQFAPAFILLGVCAPQLIVISALPLGIHILWWMVAVVALNDAGAYFAGRAFGRTKLAPALSPNKTVEGSVAGFLIGGISGPLFADLLLGHMFSLWGSVVLSVLMVAAAQVGDLSKSYLKRLRGVKDTGAIFPGHGGVLDRFDGIIGAAPVVTWWLVCTGAL